MSAGFDAEVSRAIRYCRSKSGLTSEQFAARLAELLPGHNFHRVTVSRWENGHVQPFANVLLACFEIAGVKVEW